MMLSERFLSYSKKGKLAEMATPCHSLSLAVPFIVSQGITGQSFYKGSVHADVMLFSTINYCQSFTQK